MVRWAMTDNEILLAVEEIKRLKARYFRCLDTKDWAGLETVFLPDALIDTSEANTIRGEPPPDPEWTIAGPRPWIDKLAPVLEGVLTVHHGHMPEIEILAPGAARGIWAMEDRLNWSGGVRTIQGYGHYHETYALKDGAWRIKSMKLTRLWLIVGP